MFRRHPVIGYYLLTLGISCTCELLAFRVFDHAAGLAWVGAFGPAAAALILTAWLDGRAGLEALLARLFRWRAPVWVYLAVALLPFAWLGLAYALYYGLGDPSRDIPLVSFGGWLAGLPGRLPLLLGLAPLYTVMLSGEEIGWRGFAQPRLEARWGSLGASLLVGMIWGLWHVPTLLSPDSVLYQAPLWYSIPLFTLSTMLFSIVYTWLLHNSAGSLLVMCLFHGWYDLLNSYASLYFPFFINQYWLYNLGVALTAGLLVAFAYPYRRRGRTGAPQDLQPKAL